MAAWNLYFAYEWNGRTAHVSSTERRDASRGGFKEKKEAS